MKKVIAIFAIATLVACGNASTEVTSTDSTAVAVDSTVVDTVATPVVDTTVTK
jgi:hypothetical protein